jgi:hypothetical protein
MHVSLQNDFSPEHLTPQPPQFVGSFAGLTQTPPQQRRPRGHSGTHGALASPASRPASRFPLDPDVPDVPDVPEPPLVPDVADELDRPDEPPSTSGIVALDPPQCAIAPMRQTVEPSVTIQRIAFSFGQSEQQRKPTLLP